MQDQTIINLIIGVVLSVLGWFARQLWDAVRSEEHTSELQSH